MIEQLANLPHITAIDGLTLDDINSEMVAAYEQRYKEVTGRDLTLARADPETLKLYAAAVGIYHALMLVESAALDNMLATAQGIALDNLGALKGVFRLPAQHAQVMVRFTLSAPLQDVATIPLGTRVSAGTGIYFATTEQVDIPAGELSTDIVCRCTTAGAAGTDIQSGRITTLVDRLPYVAHVENITASQGGSDIETDDSLRERIFLAPSAYSTAGPSDAYTYHTRSYSQSITSVDVYGPPDRPGVVEIRVLLEHGEIPNEAFLSGLRDHLNDRTIRPLTDRLIVEAPTVETYDLDVSYWVARSSASRSVSIQAAVQRAVDDYVAWQSAEIGRDLNPSELTRRMVEAGAKRVEIADPVFTVMPHTAVAMVGECSVRYGGIEDD